MLRATRIASMTTDEQIGRNLAALRGDMSQKDLAAVMRGRGWKWSQATVWSIEKGERPIRLAEAEEVATILNIQERELLIPKGAEHVAASSRSVGRAYSELLRASEQYDAARVGLAAQLDAVSASDWSEDLEKYGSWVDRDSVQVILDSRRHDGRIPELKPGEQATEHRGKWVGRWYHSMKLPPSSD